MKDLGRLPLRLLLPASVALIILLILPTFVVLANALTPNLIPSLTNPVIAEALRLSLMTSGISLACVIVSGTPLAYILVRYNFWGKRFLNTLLDLPLVLPPTVAGLALLLTFGRKGLIGAPLADAGISIAFTSVAVVIAQIFVASPLFIRAMKVGFTKLDSQLEGAALSLGASKLKTFWRISFPLSLPSFIEGVVLTWARALGEFGATIVFAGSLQGRTQTMPLAIYAALEQDLDVALALSALLTVVAFLVLAAFRLTVRSQQD